MILQARNLTVAIGERVLVQDLNLTLAAGQRWAILGPNGSGKTTLLHTLAGLRAPRAGSLELDGQPMASLERREIACRLGLMPQDTPDPFPATVLETALIGRHPHLSRWQWEGPDDRCRACEALETVGLAGCLARPVTRLSGGERRRLAFATLLVQDPALLLLDEPTNHLDFPHQHAVLAHLTRLTDAGHGAAMSLHDVNLASRYCSHALLMFGDGRSEQGTTGEILTAPRLERLYGMPFRDVSEAGLRLFVPWPGDPPITTTGKAD